MGNACHIVSFGYDRSLLSNRTLVLQYAGFIVDEAYSPADVLRLVLNDSVDGVVMCHSVPCKEQERAISALREIRQFIPVICIAASQWEPRKCGLIVENSPVPLVMTLRSVMARLHRDEASPE